MREVRRSGSEGGPGSIPGALTPMSARLGWRGWLAGRAPGRYGGHGPSGRPGQRAPVFDSGGYAASFGPVAHRFGDSCSGPTLHPERVLGSSQTRAVFRSPCAPIACAAAKGALRKQRHCEPPPCAGIVGGSLRSTGRHAARPLRPTRAGVWRRDFGRVNCRRCGRKGAGICPSGGWACSRICWWRGDRGKA